MATLTLQGSGVTDTDIKSNAADTVQDGSVSIRMGALPEILRIIVKFDLSSIPSGATIDDATMSLWVAQDLSSNARVASVYRIKQTVVIAEATWNSYSSGNSWSTAGCGDSTDRETDDSSDGPTIPASPSVGDRIDFVLTPAKIAGMISGGGFTNNGFLVKVATESSDLMLYDATESATSAERPKLVVNYSVGTDYTKDLTESVPLVDNLSKDVTRNLSETATIVGTALKTTTKDLTETTTLDDVLTTIRTVTKTLTETVSLVDSVLKTLTRNLVETITSVDTFSKTFTAVRTLTETITASEVFTKVATFGRRPFLLATERIRSIIASVNRKPTTSTKQEV